MAELLGMHGAYCEVDDWLECFLFKEHFVYIFLILTSVRFRYYNSYYRVLDVYFKKNFANMIQNVTHGKAVIRIQWRRLGRHAIKMLIVDEINGFVIMKFCNRLHTSTQGSGCQLTDI